MCFRIIDIISFSFLPLQTRRTVPCTRPPAWGNRRGSAPQLLADGFRFNGTKEVRAQCSSVQLWSPPPSSSPPSSSPPSTRHHRATQEGPGTEPGPTAPPRGEAREGHHLAIAEFGRGRYRRPARGLLQKAPTGQPPLGRRTYGPLLPGRVSNSNASSTTPWFVQSGRRDAEKPITTAWCARPHSCPGGARGRGQELIADPRTRCSPDRGWPPPPPRTLGQD